MISCAFALRIRTPATNVISVTVAQLLYPGGLPELVFSNLGGIGGNVQPCSRDEPGSNRHITPALKRRDVRYPRSEA
jgi:hypothetical protein